MQILSYKLMWLYHTLPKLEVGRNDLQFVSMVDMMVKHMTIHKTQTFQKIQHFTKHDITQSKYFLKKLHFKKLFHKITFHTSQEMFICVL